MFPSEEVVAVEPFNIEEKMLELEEKIRFCSDKKGYSLQFFFGQAPSKGAWLASILAILELVRLRKITMDQTELFADIYLRERRS